jgi:hypothetical protein
MSETAQMSAPTPLMQAVYRCGITLPILLPFIVSMSLEYGNPIAAIAGTPSEMLSFIVASLIIYLGFEVITTKKLKALYKTLPAYAVLFVFCIAFAFGARFIANKRNAILPKPAQIRGVILTQETRLDFTDIVLDNVTVDNEDVKEIVSTALKRCVGFGKDLFTRQTFAAEIQASVRIRLAGGRSLARVLLLTQNEYAKLTEALMADAGYVAKLRQMPSGAQIESITVGGAKVTNAQAREVYGLLSDDLAKLSDGDFRLHVIRAFDNGYYNRSQTTPPSETMEKEQFTPVDIVIVSGQVNYRRYTATYAISWLTPNALKRYVEFATFNSNAFMAAHLPASQTELEEVDFMSLTMYDLKTGRYAGSASYYTDGKQKALDDEKRLKMFTLIRSAIGRTEGDYLLRVTIEVRSAEKPDKNPRLLETTLMYLTWEQADALKALLEFR